MLGVGLGLHYPRRKPLGGSSIPVNTATPSISGIFQVGEVVSSNTGTWQGSTPITYTYQWKRNGVNISGATSNTYTIVLADEDNQLSCLVTATNDLGSASQLSNIKTVGNNSFSYTFPFQLS